MSSQPASLDELRKIADSLGIVARASLGSGTSSHETILLGKPIIATRTGMCRPTRASYFVGDKEVYVWKKEEETRTEFFFGEQNPSRKYEGDQPCFMEYCEMANNIRRVPEQELVFGEFIRDVSNLYRQNLQRLLAS